MIHLVSAELQRQRPSRRIVIEFTGVPGSGKSTAAALLRQRLENKGVRTFEREDVLRHFVHCHFYAKYHLPYSWRRFVAVRGLVAMLYALHIARLNWRNRRQAGCLGKAWRSSERRRWRWFAEGHLSVSHFRSRHWDANQQGLLLLSEGVVHHVAAMYTWCPQLSNSRLAHLLIRSMNPGALVVHVQAPVTTAVERLSQREIPRLWPANVRSNPAAVRQVVERFDGAIATCLNYLDELPCSVLAVDNSSSLPILEEAMEQLAERIVDMSGHKPPKAAETTCQLPASEPRNT